MDRDLLTEFMNEGVIPLRAKFDDFLSVRLGVRRASQIVVPAELPDAQVLGSTIDDRFRQKMEGRRLPGESLSEFFKGKMGKYWRKSQMAEVRYRMDTLRDIYADVVGKAHSYNTFIRWIDKLGLGRKELESRPTIREIYLFTDDVVAKELDELQDMRKDIRYQTLRRPDRGASPHLRVFPEEGSAPYLKRLGAILGFPACCIDRYVFDRQSGVLSPETRAANQLIHLEAPEEPNPFSYFTKDFFPCQADCEEAAALGQAMYERLLDIDPAVADKYKSHLNDNVALIRQYPEIIRNKAEALEKIAGRGDKTGHDDQE
ncbi:MAG: hypothetical protein ACOX3V_08255 [Bacillota bacterium]|jgi:hypothetical protein